MRWGGTATGTANALTISPSPSITEYVTGQSFVFKSSASANTSATTISISGLTAIAVQVDGSACTGGEIQANKWYMVVLSSTTAAQLSPIGATGIIVADAAADTTCWPLLATSQTGNQQPRTDAGLTYNASTNVLTAGEFKANGTAGGLEVTTTNSADSYQVLVAGTMTLDTATINSIQHTTTMTGGATTTSIRGLYNAVTLTPTANLTSAFGEYNLVTLNSGASITGLAGHQTQITLGASALGGTITNVYGYYCNESFNASATTDITTWNSYYADDITDGAGTTVSNARAFVGAMASGTNRYNCYMSGTAPNYFAGDLQLGKTITAAGTTGARTINQTSGSVNFAAAATSLVVTNSLATTSSVILCTVATNDATMKTVLVVAAAGSFTIHANAAATAETRVNFIVTN